MLASGGSPRHHPSRLVSRRPIQCRPPAAELTPLLKLPCWLLPASASDTCPAGAPSSFAAPSAGTTAHVCLVLPTSLCAAEAARALAADLSVAYRHRAEVRWVSLPHTEGCGVSNARRGAYTLLGHLTSPLVAHALVLEHGCVSLSCGSFSRFHRNLHFTP